ncbi:ABC transporter permease [Vibrio sp. qd031]|uniref:ABC transporter permease n=1 Tax=Vibrio sp. qd031 TaxID=1603038 RepID=UPI000A11746D|nr:ABC transporter permease [Vibrio sp. qd031]ORT49620.1 ABC transporter permease [Vibrio sp. qd031]
MQQSLDIAWLDLGLFSTLLLIPLGISQCYRLNISRDALISIARMAIQLFLVGLYLEFLFTLDSIVINISWLIVMALVGGSAITTKAQLLRKQALACVVVGLCCGLFPVLCITVVLLIQPTPLYSSQYLIPMGGMLLGNSMSAIIIALKTLTKAFSEREMEYQGAIALGVSGRYACQPFVQDALKSAFAPTLATISTTGLVSLPGMMTGQILGGVSPLIAIKYQLVIMMAIFIMMTIATTVSIEMLLKLNLSQSGANRLEHK